MNTFQTSNSQFPIPNRDSQLRRVNLIQRPSTPRLNIIPLHNPNLDPSLQSHHHIVPQVAVPVEDLVPCCFLVARDDVRVLAWPVLDQDVEDEFAEGGVWLEGGREFTSVC